MVTVTVAVTVAVTIAAVPLAGPAGRVLKHADQSAAALGLRVRFVLCVRAPLIAPGGPLADFHPDLVDWKRRLET